MKPKLYPRGFTLIELMIVVAVIGILSSIAIPQYQNYIKKSQLGSALATISALKINVEDYLATKGRFPNVSSSDMTSQLGATPSTLGTLESKAGSGSKGAGQIIFTFNAQTQFENKKLALERNETGVWDCITDINEALALPAQCTTGTVL